VGEQSVESGGGFEARVRRHAGEDEPDVDPAVPPGWIIANWLARRRLT
jgi:hypothetical protein